MVGFREWDVSDDVNVVVLELLTTGSWLAAERRFSCFGERRRVRVLSMLHWPGDGTQEIDRAMR